ncbi:ABC transporter ATP-binding protein [Subsaximicrobium wynnwilliamsii]|uniref:ABC transporter ATP-binding protein n=1 Tax=Subsaximicrobium wynnwilliamsii TaxID=291179 RepID=A0A5C6ZG46_9FLAO|nr:ABC transporter ATP-binding protein [Subsaximicrobium wynnwilliamsii]TXD89052.1 ABC transporter ATP-binding protein [Subsaximicrobium wynnwilliamsii]
MSKDAIIKVENLGKQYRLGSVGTGTLSHDINRWWQKVRGKEDPYLKIGDVNDRTSTGGSDYVWALKDVNFEVQAGEILGIIGKNGAGKSTLLKLLSRVTAPTTGMITCHGRIASLLEVGTGFHPELTGRENIYLNGAILGMTKKEIANKFDEIVDFAGCAKYIETPVKRYSSGMYVRLAFAVAAHLEPDILVVEEVLAVGDAEFQKKAIGKMKQVSEGQGRTVLFVSHNMASIQNLCNRVMVLENGTTVFRGDVASGIDFYMNANLKKSSIALVDREDRAGKKGVQFQDITIMDGKGEAIAEAFSGKPLYVDVTVKINRKLEQPIFRIMFIDTKGVIRFLCNNQFSMKSKMNLIDSGNQIIRCIIPEFPLPKGIYSVQLTCYSLEGVEDDIEAAMELTVAGGDFFNTGKEQVLKEGVLVKNTFEAL